MRIGRFLAAVAVGVAVAGTALLLGIYVGPMVYEFFFPRPEVEVPNLLGLGVDEALEILGKQKLQLELPPERAVHEVVEKDHICYQDPLPGSKVKEGAQVRIRISLGSGWIDVPSVIGMPLRQAEVMLRRGGLEPGAVSRIHSEIVLRDIVMDQNPKNSGPSTEPVNLLVSLGPKESSYALPDLSGLRPAQASRRLARFGLLLGSKKWKRDSSVPVGTVIGQEPRPGSRVFRGDRVTLVLASLDEAAASRYWHYELIRFKTPNLMDLHFKAPPAWIDLFGVIESFALADSLDPMEQFDLVDSLGSAALPGLIDGMIRVELEDDRDPELWQRSPLLLFDGFAAPNCKFKFLLPMYGKGRVSVYLNGFVWKEIAY